jgi:3-oxoacyl-[acyl-carrier protein] reductase
MKVLITGGSRGIGAECVRRFACDGNVVSFIYNNSDDKAGELFRETGALPIKADVADAEALKLAISVAAKKMGGIDVLVNNAGVALIKLLGDVTDDELKRVFDVNLVAATIAAREASAYMIRNHFGRIINVGSVWGRVGASCEVVYSASKAGLEGLTKALAKELGPSGITVNCVEPGVIDTEMNAELSEEDIKTLCDETPLCRVGTTLDVAEAVLWLASERADFITGQVLGVDGGFGI